MHEQEADGTLIVAAAQFESVADTAENLAMIGALTAEAAEQGAELVVFPEAAMYDWQVPADELAAVAEREAGGFAAGLAEIAARHATAIIAGGFFGQGARPANRMLMVGPDGADLGAYDKLHLYDAFGYRESENVLPAESTAEDPGLVLIPFRGFTLGMLNCYDLRFPEMARALVEAGADVLVESSAWVAGPYKEMHWEVLLRARAIENTSYVIASSQPPPRSSGLSAVIDPIGIAAATCVSARGLAVATISRARIAEVRAVLPVLENRRFRVSPLRRR